jgi:hypothetical protein
LLPIANFPFFLKMEQILNDINEMLTCSVCMEKYVRPKVLPCQHTFCMDCISGCVEHLYLNVQVLRKLSIFAIFNSISFIFFLATMSFMQEEVCSA